MSRWKSPQAAAKLAERAAKEAEKRRKEKRNGWLLVVCWAMVSFGLCVADYFWLRHQAQQRREQHERLYHHQPAQTNLSGTRVPSTDERTNATKP